MRTSRRSSWLILALGLGSAPLAAQAFNWSDLWARRDQQAARALERGDLERAARLAQDPLQRGAAEYRAGRYSQALEAFAGAEGADAAYNRGNALAQLGRYRDAIAAYDQALALQPEMEDAKVNRALIEQWLQQNPPAPDQQGAQQKEQNAPDDRNAESSQSSERQQDRQRTQQDQSAQEGQQQQNTSQGSQAESNRRSDTAGSNPQQTKGKQRQGGRESTGRSDPQTAEGKEGQSSANARQATQPGSTQETDPGNTDNLPVATESLSNEEQQALEQWLRRIPDDPGELLRRKFLYQYQQRGMSAGEEKGQEW